MNEYMQIRFSVCDSKGIFMNIKENEHKLKKLMEKYGTKRMKGFFFSYKR